MDDSLVGFASFWTVLGTMVFGGGGITFPGGVLIDLGSTVFDLTIGDLAAFVETGAAVVASTAGRTEPELVLEMGACTDFEVCFSFWCAFSSDVRADFGVERWSTIFWTSTLLLRTLPMLRARPFTGETDPDGNEIKFQHLWHQRCNQIHNNKAVSQFKLIIFWGSIFYCQYSC